MTATILANKMEEKIDKACEKETWVMFLFYVMSLIILNELPSWVTKMFGKVAKPKRKTGSK